MGDWWKQILNTLGGSVGILQAAASETMEEAQQRIHKTVGMVIKALVVFFLIGFGFVFGLVGLAKYLDTANSWLSGTGAMLIGGAFVVLGFFAWTMRR